MKKEKTHICVDGYIAMPTPKRVKKVKGYAILTKKGRLLKNYSFDSPYEIFQHEREAERVRDSYFEPYKLQVIPCEITYSYSINTKKK